MVPDGGTRPLEEYRSFLLMLARLQMDATLQRSIGPSDIVQETLLKAHEKRGQFRGRSAGEQVAWLRTILTHTMIDVLRHAGTETGHREQSLEAMLEQSSVRLEALLAASQSSPEEWGIRHEQLLKLSDALARLPEDQRQAIEFRHLQELPIAEIGRLMGRSTASVGGLLQRGLRRLREALAEP